MKALLLDLDDTLLAYSAGVDDSWAQACGAAALPVEAATLLAALAETRTWFWTGDPARHARERVNMLGAWTKIVAEALARCGCADETLAAAIAREYAARRRDTMRLFPETRAFLDALRTRGLPLALGTGTGSELRYPLGITIVGGLIFSQLLTLYTTPVVYLYFDRLQHWWNRARGSREQIGPLGSEA